VTDNSDRLELLLVGRMDLDGTAGLEIECPSKPAWLEEGRYVRLQASGRECACVVLAVRHGDELKAWVDRFKQRFLSAHDGSEIAVFPLRPPQATAVTVRTEGELPAGELLKRLLGEIYRGSEETAYFTLSGEPRRIDVVTTVPKGDVVVGEDTNIQVKKSQSEALPVSFADIGGLDNEIRLVRESIQIPLAAPALFNSLGVRPPRGIILYGPPGTGKTLLCRALAGEAGAYFRLVSGPELYSSTFGKSESQLREAFKQAKSHAPAVVVIDELDALVPSRDRGTQETERRMVATLLTLMDGLTELKGVVVIGTTNRIDAIDQALVREGRFWPVIRIPPPNEQGRRQILTILAESKMPLDRNVNLDDIAGRTHGFVGSDLAALCREAAYAALRRVAGTPDGTIEVEDPAILSQSVRIDKEDFEKALSIVAPSAMREFMVEMPRVRWGDIGGLKDVKKLLHENVVLSLTRRDELTQIGLSPARGILLFGPPGTGKTLLAKAIACESQANFISVQGPEMKSKWYGETESRIRHLFAKARESAPCVMFFDEIDALAPVRGRGASALEDSLVNQILAEMDGIRTAEGVVVIGATNRAELIDPALLRPGRFDYHLEVPLPDAAARRAIVELHVPRLPGSDSLNLSVLVKTCEGLSGAEIVEACRRAGWAALREVEYQPERTRLTQAHVTAALEDVRSTAEKTKTKQIGF
jgi:transitional endoplasmic reticulum ATPase